MATNWDDAEYGLTPREWLDSDAVPLTPDIDVNDPVQRSAWMRADNEENRARWLELQARRKGGDRRTDGERREDGTDEPGDAAAPSRMSATTVVPVRFLNAEQRALVRLARRQEVLVSDLVRRWVRAGLDAVNGVDHADDPADADRDLDEQDEQERRAALAAAADAMVERTRDEVRRLREIVVSSG